MCGDGWSRDILKARDPKKEPVSDLFMGLGNYKGERKGEGQIQASLRP